LTHELEKWAAEKRAYVRPCPHRGRL